MTQPNQPDPRPETLSTPTPGQPPQNDQPEAQKPSQPWSIEIGNSDDFPNEPEGTGRLYLHGQFTGKFLLTYLVAIVAQLNLLAEIQELIEPSLYAASPQRYVSGFDQPAFPAGDPDWATYPPAVLAAPDRDGGS